MIKVKCDNAAFFLCLPTPELRLWGEPDIHPVHHALSGQTGTAAASGHQGGLCPGRLLHRPVGLDLRGGPTFPGPQTHVKGQQEHRGAQGEASPASVSLPQKTKRTNSNSSLPTSIGR